MTWTCTNCGTHNASGDRCSHCGQGRTQNQTAILIAGAIVAILAIWMLVAYLAD